MISIGPGIHPSTPCNASTFFRALAHAQATYAHVLDGGQNGLKAQFNHYVRTAGNQLQVTCIPTDELSSSEAVRAAFAFSENFEISFPVILETMNQKIDKSIQAIVKAAEKFNQTTKIDLQNETRLSLAADTSRITTQNFTALCGLQGQMDKLPEIRISAEDALGEAFIPNYATAFSTLKL